jgi:putative phosphoesterase
MLIAIIADTHLPRGKRRLPPNCVERLMEAGLIIHAGDFVTLAVLDELRSYGEVVGIHGNVDDQEVRAALPQTTAFNLDGATIAVIHDAGPRIGRLARLRRRFAEADAVIFGHSHIPLHEQAEDGFQIFNPGSPTERRRAPHHTMGMARVLGGSIDFELVNLD